MILTILIITGVISGAAEAIFDVISIPTLLVQARKPRSFLGIKYRILKSDKWDPKSSWKLKYELPLQKTTTSPWYYLGLYKPTYKEKYPFSTTLLVSLTDPWHFLKLLMQPLHIISIVFCVYYAYAIKEVSDWSLLLYYFLSVFWPMMVFHVSLRYLRKGHHLSFKF